MKIYILQPKDEFLSFEALKWTSFSDLIKSALDPSSIHFSESFVDLFNEFLIEDELDKYEEFNADSMQKLTPTQREQVIEDFESFYYHYYEKIMKDLTDKFKENKQINIYRAIYLDQYDFKEIQKHLQKNGTGIYWAYESYSAMSYWDRGKTEDKHFIILRAEIDFSKIDLEETIVANMRFYADEEEFRLREDVKISITGISREDSLSDPKFEEVQFFAQTKYLK